MGYCRLSGFFRRLPVCCFRHDLYQLMICFIIEPVRKKDPQPRKAGEKDYNFHWTHTGDIWCSDGMFGQTCAIIPEQNMVIAITTADSNYLETELIQKEILDPMKEERNFAEKMWNVLKNKGLRMSLENKNRSVSNKMVSGNRKIEMEPLETELLDSWENLYDRWISAPSV